MLQLRRNCAAHRQFGQHDTLWYELACIFLHFVTLATSATKRICKSTMPRGLGLPRPNPAAPVPRAPLAYNSESEDIQEDLPGEIVLQRGARGHANAEEAERIAALDNINAPDRDPPAVAAGNARPPAIRRRVSRWKENHAKLNIMSRTVLMIPAAVESSALHSGDANQVAAVNAIKRDRERDLGWDNFKQGGQKFLMEAACLELNQDLAFRQHMDGQDLDIEILRQKYKEFTKLVTEDPAARYDGPNVHQWQLDLLQIHKLQQEQQAAVDADRAQGDQYCCDVYYYF